MTSSLTANPLAQQRRMFEKREVAKAVVGVTSVGGGGVGETIVGKSVGETSVGGGGVGETIVGKCVGESVGETSVDEGVVDENFGKGVVDDVVIGELDADVTAITGAIEPVCVVAVGVPVTVVVVAFFNLVIVVFVVVVPVDFANRSETMANLANFWIEVE